MFTANGKRQTQVVNILKQKMSRENYIKGPKFTFAFAVNVTKPLMLRALNINVLISKLTVIISIFLEKIALTTAFKGCLGTHYYLFS